MNATIAEFMLRQLSDAEDLAKRAELLAALTQLPPRRRRQLAQAVAVVCRAITSHGGTARVCFSFVQRRGHRYIEVSVREHHSPASGEHGAEASPSSGMADDAGATSIQRVGELVDFFETSGWPFDGAVVRMAQAISPAFSLPTDAEVVDWVQMLNATSVLDALALALRRAHSLQVALGNARYREELHHELAETASAAENLTMLSLVVSKTRNAISMMEPDGSITWVNDAFVQMTGYGSAEAVDKRLDEVLFGPSTGERAVEAFRSALRNGEELTQDVLQYRRDGQTYWVESNLIPVRDSAGQLTRWIAIDTDITKRRQAEEALLAAKEAAESSNRAKSEFVANLSHEIRTPMNAIIGMTDLTLETSLTQEQRDYLQTVRSSAESLLSLLNEVLDLSKIEAGKLRLEEIDFNVADVVRETINVLAVRAGEKGLSIDWHVPPDLPDVVRGEPTRLKQTLMNLIGNAIKFTDRGEVNVDVRSIWQNENEINLHFQIRDTGIGIPADKLDQIFEAFTQADSSTTRQFGGTGLGLTITAELVRLMHGRIWVESDIGQGSTFHFTVRLKVVGNRLHGPLPRQSEQDSGWSTERVVRSLKILVADDHDANRQLVTTVLRRRGHQCVAVSDGQDALDAWRREPFDVILMDVQMPTMDGLEATSRIRQEEASTEQHVPIVALTAHAMAGDRQRFLDAGMDDYLAKPLRPRDLVRAVESAWNHARELRDGSATAQQQAGSSRQPFDFSEALESMDNDLDLLIEQMQFFVNDGPTLVEQICEAIARNDPRSLEVAAHRLKGLVARYAYHEAAGLALELEQKGRQRTIEDAKPVCDKLIDMVNELADAIRRFIAEH